MFQSMDPFSECKTKTELIQIYLNELKHLENIAKIKYGIESNEFHNVLYCEINSKHRTRTPPSHSNAIKTKQQQQQQQQQQQKHKNNVNQTQDVCFNDKRSVNLIRSIQLKRNFFYIIMLTIAIFLVIYSENFTKMFMRNIQTFIYPSLRIWRLFTLPIIERFPQLSHLYDETCLITNPYFRVADSDMDCSICANVINVVDLSVSTQLGYLNNIPYIVQQEINNETLSIAQIYRVYQRNRKIFRNDAYRIYSTDQRIENLDHLFDVLLNKIESKSSHNLWRINRMEPARLLRSIFPQPKTLPPHSGIDIERYIAIDIDDGNGDDGITYQLPSTDCSNMFVYQAIGTKMIYLQPTIECRQQCRRLSVKLKQHQTLFYDWWYYKPISANQFTKTTSVTYIGSYC